jgi:glycerol-3-phosphate responsive antiterminator
MALQTLNDVVTSGILHKETEIQEDLKSGLKAVSSALRRLDEEEIVESPLDSADVVFCTLS